MCPPPLLNVQTAVFIVIVSIPILFLPVFKGLHINIASFVHVLNYVIIRGVVSFILVTGVQKPPKPPSFLSLCGVLMPNCGDILFPAEIHFFWHKFRGLGGCLDPFVAKMKLTQPHHYCASILDNILDRLIHSSKGLRFVQRINCTNPCTSQ